MKLSSDPRHIILQNTEYIFSTKPSIPLSAWIEIELRRKQQLKCNSNGRTIMDIEIMAGNSITRTHYVFSE